jgi:hypothetical protein
VSPRHVMNGVLYHDRTVQDWHRATFGVDAWAIDLDLVGACRRCREPLYLIEATTNPDKPTTILKRLSSLAGVPGILVRHRDGQIVRATWLDVPPRPIGGEEDLKDALLRLRESHEPRCDMRPKAAKSA